LPLIPKKPPLAPSCWFCKVNTSFIGGRLPRIVQSQPKTIFNEAIKFFYNLVSGHAFVARTEFLQRGFRANEQAGICTRQRWTDERLAA
jgi:hypothetical protein